MTTAEILNAAADLIEPDGAWTQNANARDASGEVVESWSDRAVCFCAYGAMRRIDHEDDGFRAERALGHYVGWADAINWNDMPGRTQAEVVEALREAAKGAA